MSGDPADAPEVTPAELQDRIDVGQSVRVLDLRDREGIDRWRLRGPSVTLTAVPYNKFVAARVRGDLDEFVAGIDGEGPITTVCARGEASAEVAAGLQAAGHDAHNLAGGMEGWARLYRSVAVDVGPATLVQYRRPASGCLGYGVVADGEMAVVDPLRAFVDRYVTDAAERDATVEYVIDTHVHADHLSGLRELAAQADATPVMPTPAVERGVAFDVETVADGDELAVGDATVEAVHAPGHTTGMTAFSVGDALLTGDSLFRESVARPDLEEDVDPREQARELYRTLTDRFARFPDETVVAPGHHGEGERPASDGSYTARLGDCRELPVLEASETEFVDRVTADPPPRPANAGRIVAANLGRETVDGDDAFELELGPNNCAVDPPAND